VTGRRRLSESISEGDGISILFEVDPTGVFDVEAAQGVAIVASAGAMPSEASLPVLVRGGSPAEAEAAGADAWLLVAETEADDLLGLYAEAVELGLECVVDIRDEEELEHVLAEVDPEIVLLSPRGVDPDVHAVDRVLELLPDVPAGKLAVAELSRPTADDLVALERAGVDGVLVASEHAATLSGP
jgi:indole-3-glycerol phosphate synthase